ncbi:MAG: hypothetical protein R3D27_09880 [Hyphomicrobiaceae bacterium]
MALKFEDLPDDAATLKAMIVAARAENDRLDAERRRLACPFRGSRSAVPAHLDHAFQANAIS